MNKTEQLSTSTQKPKIELPNKELVGVKPTKKKEINESSKLPNPTGWRILVLPFKQKDKTSGGIILGRRYNRTITSSINLWFSIIHGPTLLRQRKIPRGSLVQER